MSVRNLKDGHKKPWLCECYPNGSKGKRFATKGEATAFERYTMNEIDDKPWLGSKDDTRRLSDLLDIWWNLHGKRLKSGAGAFRRMQIVCEQLNNPLATTFTAKDYAYYRASRLTMGRGATRNGTELSISSQNYDLLWMKTIFNELRRLDEWKQPNPLEDIKAIKTSERELTYLSSEQITQLLTFVQRSPISEQLTQIIKICLATGARIMEAIQLKGSQVTKHKITFINTKGKRNRTVPISESLYNEIHQNTSGRLFTCGYGVVHKWLSNCFDELPRGQATHILRHTFASSFMMHGGNILVLQKILGHVDIKQTMAYSHFAPSHLQDAVLFNPLANMN